MGRRQLPIGDRVEPAQAALAEALREVVVRAGRPTLRELASRSHVGRSTLSDTLAGRTRPSWTVTQALLCACDIREADMREWQRRWLSARRGAVESVTPEPITIAILDPYEVAMHGLTFLLRTDPGIKIVAVAEDLDQLLLEVDVASNSLSRRWPDLVLAELYRRDGQPGEPALELIAQLAERGPVLVTAVSCRPGDAVAAIQAGASGYLYQGDAPDTILQAVERVALGGVFISSDVSDSSADVPHPRVFGGGRVWLSTREQETVGHIAAGLTPAQTAQKMGVARSTIDSYLARIRAKTNRSHPPER